MLAATSSNSALWYLARGTGIVTVVLLSASVTLGIVTTMRWSTWEWPRFVVAALHKNISLLAVTFLGIHIATTLLDPVSPVHLVNALVPFTGHYRAFGVGLGVIAFDLLVALIATSLLRQHIGYRAWRAVHWCAYACWPIAMLHGLEAGTDASAGWAQLVYSVCAGVVFVAVLWRLAIPVPKRTARAPLTGVAR
jgi:sulfoxide reductase heme-binding subunit YedZ